MFGEKNQKDKEDSLEYVLNPDALTEEDLNIFLRQLQSTTPFENSYNELSDLQVIDADSFLATEPSGESVDAENVKSDSNRKRKSENLSSSEPAKKISKSCEYRRQFIYKDLIERGDLRLHEKLVPVN
ncbi:hypothetical protein [Legionella brunensis]|nr:hypothetical protein [Legionella brunensis]